MAVHFQVHSHLLLAISMLVLKGSKFSNKKKGLFWKGENNPRISLSSTKFQHLPLCPTDHWAYSPYLAHTET